MLETRIEPEQPALRWDGSEGEAIRARRRRANDYMRDALRLLDPDETIPFFCECDRAECFAIVWLTSRRFDRVRATPDHDVSAHGEPLPVPAGT